MVSLFFLGFYRNQALGGEDPTFGGGGGGGGGGGYQPCTQARGGPAMQKYVMCHFKLVWVCPWRHLLSRP